MRAARRAIAAVADEIMTYRRDPSDLGVIVRHANERHADTTMRHPSADATPAGCADPCAHHASHHVPRRHPFWDATASGPRRRPVARQRDRDATRVRRSPRSHPREVRFQAGRDARARDPVCGSRRNYVRIHMESGTVFKSRVPIDRLALHLGRERFLRIHRGCIVNVDRVRAVTPLLGGRLLLALSDGSRVMVARDRRRFVLAEIGAGTTPRS